MTPGTRALVEFLAEQLAAPVLERAAADVDQTLVRVENAPIVSEEVEGSA